MTRKRFIKLLMASGYSRNEACATARLVPGDSTYANTYATIMVMKAIPSLSDAISSMAETVGRLCAAVTEGVAAFIEAFNNSMEGDHERQ